MAKKPNEHDSLSKQFGQKPKLIPNYVIHRDVLTQSSVITISGYQCRDKSIPYTLRQYFSNLSFFGMFRGLIPILHWLPNYSFKNFFIGDLIAGITVAVMHIPQGMAYGILAGVEASVGLYMAFFPALFYMIFGTSRHISIGTFAIVSIMTSKVVQSYATTKSKITNDVALEAVIDSEYVTEVYTPMECVTALAVIVGIIHLIMSVLRLGVIASLLSEPLVNGFTTAAAVHVIAAQLRDVLGIETPKHKGAFKIIYTVIDLFGYISTSNIAAVIFSIGIISFMILCNEFVKPWLSKKCRFPLPAELIAVVGGTLISRYVDVNGHYDVQLVGEIPRGLPSPKFPPLSLFYLIYTDAIAIAIVSYSIVMSMSLIFAKKNSYEISANQELFAMGISNIVGGCFSCIPLACSLSRSLIQEQTGGKTQIASLISSLLILMVLLWIGPFFETLPRCVLAGIIIVALKGIFMQAKELKKFSKQGKLELFTWLCTFVGVVLIDIDIGLVCGILMSVMGIYIKGLKPYGALLGKPLTSNQVGVYVDLKNHHNAVEVPQTKIYRYCGSINFATKNSYKKKLYEAIEINQEKIRRASTAEALSINGSLLKVFHSLILDFSALGHIDVAGCSVLTEILKDMQILGVRLFLAAPSDRVYDSLMHSVSLGEGPFEIFPSLHDAVLYAEACRTA